MPIDVASGNLHLEFEDARISGKVALVWDRRYSGNLLPRPGILGPGWRNRYEATLTRHAEGFEFVSPSGAASVVLDSAHGVERGHVIRQLSGSFEIFARDGRYVVQTWNTSSNEVLRYVFSPGEVGQTLPLLRIEDLAGNGLDLIRDRTNRLVEVRQRLEGRSLRLSYHVNGLVSAVSVESRSGNSQPIARYEYTDDGRLHAAFDALEYASRYEYDQNGRLARQVAKDGAVVSYRYDRQGRCNAMSGLDRYDYKRLRFIDAARVTEVTDSYGSVSRYQCLSTGQVVSEWSPTGEATQSEFDEFGRLVATITPSGAATRYEYDESGNIARVTDAAGAAIAFQYNVSHQPITITDPLGGVWTRDYDEFGQLVRAEDPAGGVYSWAYDAQANRVRATTPSGATTRFVYHEDGTLHQVIAPDGATTSVLFDDFGLPVMRVNPRGGVVQATYDARGNPTTIRRPDGTLVRYEYDAAGNITYREDGTGAVTRFEWGTCGRLARRIDALGRVLVYTWGTEPDRLLSIVNESGDRYELTYDAAGRLSHERSFDGLVQEFQYDRDGRLLRRRRGDQITQEFAYDATGRLQRRVASDGTSSEFEYDLLGRLTAAINATCVVRYAYDAVGNVIDERQDEFVVQSRYHADGHLVGKRSSLGFEAAYAIDAAGRPQRVTVMGTHAYEFAYDAAGDEVSRSLPDGSTLVQDRDDRGRVLRQFVTSDDGTAGSPNVRGYLYAPLGRAYRYDANNAPTWETDRRRGDVAYSYDPAQQLTAIDGAAERRERFQYTPTGSLATIATPTGDTHLSYAGGNRLVSVNATTYEHDGLGRRTAERGAAEGESRRFSWDGFDRLIAVETATGERWEYRYDALGRRVAKKGPKGIERFVWSGDTILHRVRPRRQVESWLHDDARLVPIAKVQADSVYSAVLDQLGTPRELLDREGTVVWSASVSAWGRVVPQATARVDCEFRFPGQWYDAETGLHYNRHRYYDPSVGQFISQDPIGIEGGLNLYRYAPNPLNFVDLFGLTVCENRKKGEDFKNAVKEELQKAGYIVVEEVTIKVDTGSGTTTTRVDLLVMDQHGNPVLVECKASPTAPYTDNQKAAGIPTGEQKPGAPPGSLAGPAEYRTDKGGIDKGTAVPSSATVVTVRPGDPIPLTGATAPHPP
jgi:RHS repeat-associated protein